MHKRIAILRKTAATLRAINKVHLPKPPFPAAQAALDAYSKSYSRWVEDTSKACLELATSWEKAINSADTLMKATDSMQETQMSFNLQYLQLQSQMQNENRSYTAVSNIMKTKHDTVKNSISNVR